MSVSSSTVKSVTRRILKENLTNTVVASTIVLTVWFICYNLFAIVAIITDSVLSYVLLALASVFILLPLSLGILRYYWRIALGVADNPATCFYYFSSRFLYTKVLKLIFTLLFRTFFVYSVLFLPTLIFQIITGSWLYNALNITVPIWTVNFSYVSYFLNLLALLGTLFSMLKFYLAPMLFVADENMEPDEALHMSTVLSKRSSIDFIFLCLSFLGWIIISFFAVPLIFTIPYMLLAYLIHCSYTVCAFNEELSNISLDEIPTYIAGV